MQKPGFKTSEFWLAIFVAVGGAAVAIWGDKEWTQLAGVVAATVASMGYGMQRTQLKSLDEGAPELVELEAEDFDEYEFEDEYDDDEDGEDEAAADVIDEDDELAQ